MTLINVTKHTLLFTSSLSICHSLHHTETTHTHTAHSVIYLKPIVNSSLRLDENVERRLQSYANAGHLVKAKYTKYQHITAGTAARGQQAGGGRGSKEATTRLAHVKPFRGHAVKCRSLTVLYCMCFLKRNGGLTKNPPTDTYTSSLKKHHTCDTYCQLFFHSLSQCHTYYLPDVSFKPYGLKLSKTVKCRVFIRVRHCSRFILLQIKILKTVTSAY